jgi:hypothetical protein
MKPMVDHTISSRQNLDYVARNGQYFLNLYVEYSGLDLREMVHLHASGIGLCFIQLHPAIQFNMKRRELYNFQ